MKPFKKKKNLPGIQRNRKISPITKRKINHQTSPEMTEMVDLQMDP